MSNSSKKSSLQGSQSRRHFVKSAAYIAGGVGAASLLAGCDSAAASDQVRTYTGLQDFFDIPLGQNSAEEVVEKCNIKELVEYDRYCRDYGLWDQMSVGYAEDSEVVVSWMSGTGKEFIEQSKEKPPSNGGHKIFNTVVWLNGDKAIAEIMCVIVPRFTVQGVEYDAPAYSRMLYRVEKISDKWKIKRFESIYEKDSLVQAFPTQSTSLDPQLFEGYRESYKGICFLQADQGRTPNPDLPGDDLPETVQTVYRAASKWLFD